MLAGIGATGGNVMRGRVLFIANSLDNAFKFQQVLSELDVETTAASTAQIARLLGKDLNIDLVIFEARASAAGYLEQVESLVKHLMCSLLVIVEEADAGSLRLPKRSPCDFVLHDAGPAECKARVRRLLGNKGAANWTEIISVEDMAINLATYQVTVAGSPIDFTYLEYALLAFLVQHADRTFSRDSLLQNVWGFDYYGGSRTVDVHVRRIRAKLGPNLAQRLKTVRGVGYLWSSQGL